MAIHDKNPLSLKDNNPTLIQKDTAAPVIDKEHIKRHNDAEKHDKELSLSLQANWGKRVDAEHRAH